MKTYDELEEWIVRALDELGDPAIPVCQLFFGWTGGNLRMWSGEDLVCGPSPRPDTILLQLDRQSMPLPIPIASTTEYDVGGGVLRYGMEPIAAGVWALRPSLNIPGVIHAFVVLYGVPEPAPWQRLVVLATEIA